MRFVWDNADLCSIEFTLHLYSLALNTPVLEPGRLQTQTGVAGLAAQLVGNVMAFSLLHILQLIEQSGAWPGQAE